MEYTLEEIQFGGKVHTVAEDELNVSVTGDRDDLYIPALFREYAAAGKPKNVKAWIRNRLKNDFQCRDKRPVWVESRPAWPLLNGRPMVFIEQIETGDGDVAKGKLASAHVLYVFGARVVEEKGWRMEYKVVAQNKEFGKGVVLLAKDEDSFEKNDLKEFKLVRKRQR